MRSLDSRLMRHTNNGEPFYIVCFASSNLPFDSIHYSWASSKDSTCVASIYLVAQTSAHTTVQSIDYVGPHIRS